MASIRRRAVKLIGQLTPQLCDDGSSLKNMNSFGLAKLINWRPFSHCTSTKSELLNKSKNIFSISECLMEHPGNNRKITISNQLLSNDRGSKLIDDECDKDSGARKEGSGPCHHQKTPKKVCVPVEIPKWKGKCLQVCLPCCKPREPLDACKENIVMANKCKPKKYKYRGYAESLGAVPIEKEWMSDCCYWPKCCKRTDVGVPPLVSTYQTQRDMLGFKKKPIVKSVEKKAFSTFTGTLYNKDKKGDCGSGGALPCLKRDPTIRKKPIKSNKTCDKVCMPCCKPARDPPECFFPYIKPPCDKKKPPRPSFSECQDVLRNVPPCECLPPVPTCGKKSDKDDAGGCSKK